jgi:archaellum component FlaC
MEGNISNQSIIVLINISHQRLLLIAVAFNLDSLNNRDQGSDDEVEDLRSERDRLAKDLEDLKAKYNQVSIS